VVVALPQFLKNTVVEGPCYPGCQCLYVVPGSTLNSLKERRVYNVVWMLVGVVLPLGCLLVAGGKLVRALRAVRRRNEVASVSNEHRQRQHSRPSPVTTTVVGTAVSFILLVCPSIIVDLVEL